ncbi:MAG: hypothetical protein ACREMI_00420 [Gemmatimonadales bacterium]
MHRATLVSLVLFAAPLALTAQQSTAPPPAPVPAAPHDSVRGAIRAVDVRARTLEVTTGVGFALRIVRLEVPAGVPITDREDGPPERIGLAELKLGDVVRAVFGGRAKRFVAYTIERVGRMETGVDSTP